MLRIELSALSAQELRRLLEMARARGQGPLIEQLEAELKARPARPEDWAPAPVTYAQHLVFEAEEVPERPRRNGAMAATAVIAAFVSAAVTWGLYVPAAPRADAVPRPSQPPPRAAVVLASMTPVAPPPAFTGTPASAAVGDTADPPPPKARVAAVKSRAPTRRTRENPCLDLPTAAERLVCGYPSLAAQDRQLRSAYERALSAGADRRELDRAQAVWRDDSEEIADRQQLADRYDRRIRELESAAVRPPPEDPPF